MNDTFQHVSCLGLGLELDVSRHKATRGEHSICFGGQCRLWKILVELGKRFDGFLCKDDLIRVVWDEFIPEETTVYAAVSELRKLLRQLGLDIKCTKVLGYRLEDLATKPMLEAMGHMQSC